MQDPIPFTQSSWGQVGEAACISILDLYGHNCHSRLPNTRQASLRGLLGQTIRPRTGRTTRVKDVLPNGVGLSIDDIAARERSCRGACGWHEGREKDKDVPPTIPKASRLSSKEPIRPTSKAGRKPSKQAEGESDVVQSSKSMREAREVREVRELLRQEDLPSRMRSLRPDPVPSPSPEQKEQKPSPVESKAQRSRSLDLRRGQSRVERLPLALLRAETPDSKSRDGKSGKEAAAKALPRNSMQLVRPQRRRTHSLEASQGIPKTDLGAKVRPQLLLEISTRTGAAVTVGAC